MKEIERIFNIFQLFSKVIYCPRTQHLSQFSSYTSNQLPSEISFSHPTKHVTDCTIRQNLRKTKQKKNPSSCNEHNHPHTALPCKPIKRTLLALAFFPERRLSCVLCCERQHTVPQSISDKSFIAGANTPQNWVCFVGFSNF